MKTPERVTQINLSKIAPLLCRLQQSPYFTDYAIARKRCVMQK